MDNNKLNELAYRIRDLLQKEGYDTRYSINNNGSILLYVHMTIEDSEDLKKALNVFKILTKAYDKLKDIKLIHEHIYIKIQGMYTDIEAKTSFVNGTLSIDKFTVMEKQEWTDLAFWEYMAMHYKDYFTNSEWKRLEKFLETNEKYFIDLYNKAYEKMRKIAEEYVKEGLIEGWDDLSDNWDTGIELVVWKSTKNLDEVEEIVKDLEKYAYTLLEEFEEELIRLLQETVRIKSKST